MTSQRIPIHNPDSLIKDLKENEIPFKLYVTTFTKKLECMLGTYFYSLSSGIKMREMYFINKIKKHCETILNLPKIKQSNIKYIDKRISRKVIFKKELYEIDLSSAYWNFALKEKFITQEIYDEGLKLSKKIRLISLGSLAKQVTLMVYDGREFISVEKEELSPVSNIFFKVSLMTDMALKHAYLLAGKGGLFYWVDAVFVRGKDNFEKVQEFFNQENMPFKYYKIDKIYFKYSEIKVYSKDWKEKHESEKEFRLFNFDK